MKQYDTRQHGFAHPVLVVVLMVAVVGVVGFSGYRVMSRNKTAEVQNAPVAATQIVINTETPEAQEAEASSPAPQLVIKSPGSAAVQPKATALSTAPTSVASPSSGSAAARSGAVGTIKVSSQYDVATPIGSLSQLLLEAKQGDYGNALYFVTPGFVSRVYQAVGAQDFSQFISSCETNDACKMLASTKVSLDMSHINESDCTVPSGSVFSSCKRIWTKFVYEDSAVKTVYYKTVGYHVHEASITMMKSDDSTNWVIDTVSVDSFTL